MSPTATMNGQEGVSREAIVDQLIGEPLTEGYRPTQPLWTMFNLGENIPQFAEDL